MRSTGRSRKPSRTESSISKKDIAATLAGRNFNRSGKAEGTCDATGNRDYVYDLACHWVLEVSNAGTQCKSEIYAAGRHYVTDVDGQTHFDHSDWLGTVRLRNTYSNPNSFETCTSLPFGDALTCTPSDSSTIHFTGKDRDSESGLDNFGARYNSSITGRFMSPDWSADPSDVPYADFDEPQSLNLYTNGRNNPENTRDADGHCVDVLTCGLEGAGIGEFLGPIAAAVGGVVGVAIGGYILYEAGTAAKSLLTSPTAPAQMGQRDADYVVSPGGTVVATDPQRVRDSLSNAPGVTTTPVTGPTGESGAIQTGVQTPNGPVDVKTMDGSKDHSPRTVITHPGTNTPKTPDGKATNDKNDNHIPNESRTPKPPQQQQPMAMQCVSPSSGCPQNANMGMSPP